VQEEELLFRDKKAQKAQKAAQEQDVNRDGTAGETADEGTVKVEKIGSARFY
jgi:hypothetical protein